MTNSARPKHNARSRTVKGVAEHPLALKERAKAGALPALLFCFLGARSAPEDLPKSFWAAMMKDRDAERARQVLERARPLSTSPASLAWQLP